MRLSLSRRLAMPLTAAVAAAGLLLTGVSPATAADAPTWVPARGEKGSVTGANGVTYPVDGAGRALVLHGWEAANDTCDGDPFATVRAALPAMAADGFNAIRVPINWECIEPEAGRYDQAYLASYKSIFGVAEAHKVAVTPDFNDHFPQWVLDQTGRDSGAQYPLLGSTGSASIPFLDSASSAGISALGKHGDPQFLGAWGLLYTDADVRAAFVRVWIELVRQFKDEPALLGYDLLNEPWYDPIAGGHPLVDPPSALAAERDLLTPLYQDLVDEIRKVDDTHQILVEPFWGGVGSLTLPTALGSIHDPADRLVYAPHVYDLIMEAGGDYLPATGFVDRYWAAVTGYAADRRLPMLIWEWGPRDPATPNADRFVRDVLAGVDAHAAGYMAFAWCRGLSEWCNLGADGRPGGPMARTLGPYARAVAGAPVEMRGTPDTLSLRYRPSTTGNSDQVTELFAPSDPPGGRTVRVSGGQIVSGADSDIVEVRNCAGSTEVRVEITAGNGPSSSGCDEAGQG